MAKYNAIKIVKGAGGFGGPLVVKPEEGKDKLVYICAGAEPEIVSHICKLSGATPVNGFKTSVPDSEIFLVIVDCGGTLRCGIYPQKRIPTINVNPVGQAGPLAKYIVEDIYCSAVGVDEITLAQEDTESVETKENKSEVAESGKSNGLQNVDGESGKGVSVLNQENRQMIQKVLKIAVPIVVVVAILLILF